MDSLKASDAAAGAVATHARVKLEDIEGAILAEHYVSGTTIMNCADHSEGDDSPDDAMIEQIRALTVCMLVIRNGFTVIGTSAPASAQNYNAELGRKFAREDAIRKLWGHMGFALRDRLAAKRG